MRVPTKARSTRTSRPLLTKEGGEGEAYAEIEGAVGGVFPTYEAMEVMPQEGLIISKRRFAKLRYFPNSGFACWVSDSRVSVGHLSRASMY